jgi:hypothetical protein
MKLITSPEPLPPVLQDGESPRADQPYVFLAGSIEQDKAVNWQQRAISQLGDLPGTIFNPRRVEWDASWGEDDPRFIEQVQWELRAMYQADIIMMHFEPSTMSPITLLELGLYCDSGKLYVSCPKGYWRRGNVRIICDSVGVRVHDSLEELLETVREATVNHVYKMADLAFHASFKPRQRSL